MAKTGFKKELSGNNFADCAEGIVLSRRDFIVTGSGFVAATALGCGGGGEEPGAASSGAADQAAQGTPWAGTEEIADLRDRLHLADIFHRGEFMDFGTAARFKYTLGGWMSGFDNDTDMNGRSYTFATKSPSRMYFSTLEKKPLSFIFRVKKGGSDYFSVYLNDNPLIRVSLKSDDWEEHRVDAPADAVVQGENYLKLIYKTAEEQVGGAPASFALDYVRVLHDPADEKGVFDPPHLSALRQHYKVGQEEKPSIIVPTPTTLSYYVDVPPSASLCLSAAVAQTPGGDKKPTARLSVRATPVNGGGPTELLEKKYADTSWHDEMMDLGPLAGQLVRLDIATDGDSGGRLVLGRPALRTKPPKIEGGDKKVKNVVVVMIDTLRADKLTAYSKTRVRTPAFDKFVKESTLFERCQAPSNWTKPSCATILTGLYPDTHKTRGHGSRLPASVKMASEMFAGAGFATGAFIANGYLAAEFGFDRGWTKYVNFIRENRQTEAEHVYKESLDFVAASKDKPFFAYVQTIDPHVPYDPPAEDLKLYDAQAYSGPVSARSTGNLLEEFKRKKVTLEARDRRRLEALYDGEVTYHDRHFGHFLDGLNKQGVLDDTIIVVCSDHGEEFFEHESVGHGHTLHQELLHVPLVMRAPGLVPGGRRLTKSVGLGDILPTVLAASGVEIPTPLEGRDLIPACNGALDDPLDASFSSFYSEADERNLSWCVRKNDFKLRMKGPAVTYVYHLGDDPRERVDVDVKYPLALRALRISLGQFIGAPDKAKWTDGDIAMASVSKPKAGKADEAEVPEDLKAQLRALGYMQ
jgi:choline-sulfatase